MALASRRSLATCSRTALGVAPGFVVRWLDGDVGIGFVGVVGEGGSDLM